MAYPRLMSHRIGALVWPLVASASVLWCPSPPADWMEKGTTGLLPRLTVTALHGTHRQSHTHLASVCMGPLDKTEERILATCTFPAIADTSNATIVFRVILGIVAAFVVYMVVAVLIGFVVTITRHLLPKNRKRRAIRRVVADHLVEKYGADHNYPIPDSLIETVFDCLDQLAQFLVIRNAAGVCHYTRVILKCFEEIDTHPSFHTEWHQYIGNRIVDFAVVVDDGIVSLPTINLEQWRIFVSSLTAANAQERIRELSVHGLIDQQSVGDALSKRP